MPLLKGGHPQQVQRVRLSRRRLQDLGADSGGVGQVARLRQIARQGQCFFDGERLRHRISIAAAPVAGAIRRRAAACDAP
jgi:hypothetical protein